MDLEEFRILFVTGSFILVLIAATPTLYLILPSRTGADPFSEFWILGPNHRAEGYPFSIRVNESNDLFVGVRNHMGSTSYYSIYAKLRNPAQPFPNTTTSEPSPLAPLAETRILLVDSETWEMLFRFRILEVSRFGDFVVIRRMSINDVDVSVYASTTWNSEYHGFYYQLFLELWLYDVSLQSFRFHDRFVGVWLNLTE